MARSPLVLLLLGAGCQADPGPDAALVQPTEQPDEAPRRAGEPDDPCDPLPQNGDPCSAAGSWCVIDWGRPCGASTARWCRDGVWMTEQESNLCDDDR